MLNCQSCILHTLNKFIPLQVQLSMGCCVQCSEVFVTVERGTRPIRLKVGSNDAAAEVSPN